MTTTTARTLALTALAFVTAHVTASVARPAAAAPTCNQLCKNATYNRLCGTGGNKDLYVEWRFMECQFCFNSILGSVSCEDGVDVPCNDHTEEGKRQQIRTSLKGTPSSCTCKSGINTTDASALTPDENTKWMDTDKWKVCGDKKLS